jgi:PAS domain S-box-containing protein
MSIEAVCVLWAALAAAAIGVLVIAGWAFDVETLMSPIHGATAMKFNVALSLILAAGALALTTTAEQSAARSILLLLVLIIAALTLAEYLFNIDLGIDQLVFVDRTLSTQSIPGRMSAVSSIAFALFSIALAVPARHSRLADHGFVALTNLGLFIAFVALIGYAFGTPLLYHATPETSIAVHSAVALIVLFICAMASRPQIGWLKLFRSDTVTGRYAPYMLPAAVAVPIVLGLAIQRGHTLDRFDVPTAMALYSVACAVLLSGLVWAGGAYANRLGRDRARGERLFQNIADTAMDAIILVDARGSIVEWNPQAERIFGWPRAEAVGRRIARTIFPEEEREPYESELRNFLETGESVMVQRLMEIRAVRRDGETFPAEWIVTPVTIDDELYFSGFVRDISAAKSSAAQLRQAQKMEAVGQLAGGMAHDFNNLLTVVVGGIDSVLNRVADDVRPRLEAALYAAERGATLVRQLLAYSRRQTLNPSRIDLSQIVTEMEELLRRTLGAQIEVKANLEGEIWPCFADRAQVESALLNMAINARDAMPEGGTLTIETGNVELDAEYAALNAEVTVGQYVMIAVSDSGTGIPPEILSRVFEPFFSTKEVGKGSGLGLSMIYGFAKQSMGHVKIYSEVGHGTTIRLYLPRPRTETMIGAIAVPAPADAPLRGGEETVLLVEDDPHVRGFAVTYLSSLGYAVIEATTGAEALVVLEEKGRRIDLLFTDIMMPGNMSGRALAEAAWRTRPHLKVLFTSGYADASVINNGLLKAGAKFLSKPYKGGDLARLLRQILDGDA